MASPKSKLPKREKEICQRFRLVRERLRFTQEEFAEQLQISRARLASYEEQRVPIRWEIALRTCKQFIVSERWLATGAGAADWRQTMSLIDDSLCRYTAPSLLFSSAFDQILGARFKELAQLHRGKIFLTLTEAVTPTMARNIFSLYLDLWLDRLKKHDRGELSFGELCGYLAARGNWFVEFTEENDAFPREKDELAEVKRFWKLPT